jgi:hypothetical protein
MENISTAILIFLGIIVFQNYRKSTLGQWVKAKFLNSEAGKPSTSSSNAPAGFTQPTASNELQWT